MGVIKTMQLLIDDDLEKKYAAIRYAARYLEKLVRPCVCGGIAPPIKTKIYIYQCIRCDKQFADISSDLGRKQLNDFLTVSFKDFNHLLDMAYYDEVIALLKQKASDSRSSPKAVMLYETNL